MGDIIITNTCNIYKLLPYVGFQDLDSSGQPTKIVGTIQSGQKVNVKREGTHGNGIFSKKILFLDDETFFFEEEAFIKETQNKIPILNEVDKIRLSNDTLKTTTDSEISKSPTVKVAVALGLIGIIYMIIKKK
jgi:hypothetical protein